MQPPLLTIGIPTYNRHAKLRRCLQALALEPLPPNVEILVVDNHSEPPVSGGELGCITPESFRCRIVRNPANIGLAANINRVIEHAQGEWVWLLGDEDIPLPGSVHSVLDEISNQDNQHVFLHKFNSTNGGQTTEHRIISSLEDLADCCQEPGFFSNLLFISSSVFHHPSYLRHLSVAYQFNSSMAPHLVATFEANPQGHV